MHHSASRRVLFAFLVLVPAASILAWNGQPGNARPTPVAITVDASQAIGPMRPVWAWFGYDEPNYTYMKDGKAKPYDGDLADYKARVVGRRVVVVADLDYEREGTVTDVVDGMLAVVLDGDDDPTFYGRDELAAVAS